MHPPARRPRCFVRLPRLGRLLPGVAVVGQGAAAAAAPGADGMDASAAVLQGLLAFVWAPCLVLAGVLDWACHRRLRIECSAGPPESLLHLLMIATLGAALLAALFLAPTAGLFVLLFVALLVHEVSYLADLRVALASRPIPPVEQWVHGFQHLLPWAGFAGLLALSPGQALALLHVVTGGGAGEAADWALRPAWAYTLPLLAAALLFNVLPFLGETRRSMKARRAGGTRG